MSARTICSAALLGLLAMTALLPAHAATRHIALLADTLSKSGTASVAASTPWPGQPDATVVSGPSLTRATVARLLGDPALRGQPLVLLLRGTTTAGPTAPPAWLVHSSRKGVDALLDRERLITAADLRGWIARSGASETTLIVEANGPADAFCASLGDTAPGAPRITVRCQRGDAGGGAAKSLDLGAPASFYYLLEPGFRCQPAMPGAATVASWVDRIEWPGSAANALRWGSRCNDSGVALDPAVAAPRLSSDGELLLYHGRRYLRLAQPPAGDGFDTGGQR